MAPLIIAVCNQKGGVGKTTLVTGLSEVMARTLKLKVLVIDADPQFNVTSAFGIHDLKFTLNDVLSGDPDHKHKIFPGVAADAIVPLGDRWQGDFPQIDLIGSERNLASRELDSMMARERRLKTAIKGVADKYDVVLIDCAPSLGLLTVNALTAATHVLMVSELRVASVEGLKEMVTTIAEVQENLNEDLDVIGIVGNRKVKNRVDQEQWVRRLQQDYGDFLLEPHLPERELFAQAQATSRPLKSFGSKSKLEVDALERLARKILEKATA